MRGKKKKKETHHICWVYSYSKTLASSGQGRLTGKTILSGVQEYLTFKERTAVHQKAISQTSLFTRNVNRWKWGVSYIDFCSNIYTCQELKSHIPSLTLSSCLKIPHVIPFVKLHPPQSCKRFYLRGGAQAERGGMLEWMKSVIADNLMFLKSDTRERKSSPVSSP